MEPSRSAEQRSRLRVALLSLTAGAGILGLKVVAYALSGSVALKSDAVEGVVNVGAAAFALGAVIFAGKPADRDHPYGHGKIEHFSAAFEGGLVSLAAAYIILEAGAALLHGSPLKDLGLGLAVNVVAGALNGALGWYLVRQGRKTHSQALEADGHHVLSDFWTTLGLCAGLLAVKATGLRWLDPVLALAVGLLLARTGFRLVRRAARALLDEEDPAVVERLVGAMNRLRPWDILAVHELRTFRTGRHTHVDVHLVVPEYYPLRQAHDLCETFGQRVLDEAGIEGEMHVHLDPCGHLVCGRCAAEACPIRERPWMDTPAFTQEEAVVAGPSRDTADSR
ncbi:cation diffusion facilitator family transporter [Geothrix sp. 21YS21S-4]|uniref:cation diffusion facilitator family transporter n=1 Tax=Geothrix sp. 21YS21S-4 TaxID=3068889 RepID=UPI0027BA232F|nr:cation diffusion facilitator family transporter [Geothrix sp. 21YS21S-4]